MPAVAPRRASVCRTDAFTAWSKILNLPVERTADTQAGLGHHVSVDHRRTDVAVAEQVLNGADIVAPTFRGNSTYYLSCISPKALLHSFHLREISPEICQAFRAAE